MPIYEYKCANCGKQLEVMQKISESPLQECPNCHENKLEKQWSLSGFQFKGTGWYVSDYTNRNSESGSESKGESGSETKGESGAAEKSAVENSKPDGAAKSSESESTAAPAAASKSEPKAVKPE